MKQKLDKKYSTIFKNLATFKFKPSRLHIKTNMSYLIIYLLYVRLIIKIFFLKLYFNTDQIKMSVNI